MGAVGKDWIGIAAVELHSDIIPIKPHPFPSCFPAGQIAPIGVRGLNLKILSTAAIHTF